MQHDRGERIRGEIETQQLFMRSVNVWSAPVPVFMYPVAHTLVGETTATPPNAVVPRGGLDWTLVSDHFEPSHRRASPWKLSKLGEASPTARTSVEDTASTP